MPVSTEQPGADEATAVPIREVSRLTGINSITLRAWERRYGLLKPLRTAKGHRLYRPEDIARVKAIQSWLSRGLAIGKVKDILAAGEDEQQALISDDLWQHTSARLRAIAASLNRHQLEALLAELTADYPIEVLADELIAPLLNQWQLAPRFGSECQRAFFEMGLKEHFYATLRRQRQQARGPVILLLDLCNIEPSPLALILNYGLSVQGYAVDGFGVLAPTECVFAAEQRRSQAVIVYADRHTPDLLQRLAELKQLLKVPVLFAGPMSDAYQTQIPADLNLLGQTHQEILTQLANRFGGGHHG